MNTVIEPTWNQVLTKEFQKSYFNKLANFVDLAYKRETVYPAAENIFKAFTLCPHDQVKVVILGQDPYHGPDQAQGLAFSVPDGTKIPPSLRNIYKELHTDLGLPIPNNGNLEHWARQGVLLLNSTLTVAAGRPGSHQKQGWEQFTDTVISKLSNEREHLVFILWGNYAKSKGAHIDRNKHLALEAAHPSPLGAYKGFYGCKHFSKTNEYLEAHNNLPLSW